MHRRDVISLMATAALASMAPPAIARRKFPTKPVSLIVPFAAGGTTDIVARVVSDPLSQILGQPVIVENRAGAGGIVGSAEVGRARPDGHILGVTTLSAMATNPAINPQTPYDPATAFTFIANMAETPNIIAVNKDFPAKDFAEFMKVVKANPGKFTHASSGTGGIQHLLMELFKGIAGLDMIHVPYRGAGPALSDAVGGQVHMVLDNLPSTLNFIKSGHLRPIVVASPVRASVLPDTPTFEEVGFKQLNRTAYYGVFGPKGLPPEIVAQLNEAINKVLAQPDVIKRIEATGSMTVIQTPKQFAERNLDELKVYREVVKSRKLTL